MTDLLDAVQWRALVPLSGPVACYRDGRLSQWPAEAIVALRPRVAINITVLADPAWEVFDSETGNAGVDNVAASVRARLDKGLWSWVYTNEANLNGQTAALLARGVHWTDRAMFPEPGCYLWAAAPGTTPGTTPLWCPVPPVAVQDRWMGDHDVSTLYVDLTPKPAPKPPQPAPQPAPVPLEVLFAMNVAQVRQGASGAPVRALQTLLNGWAGDNLTLDGIFGPKTDAAVRAYQHRAGVTVDGVAGPHTWGHLLGVPQ